MKRIAKIFFICIVVLVSQILVSKNAFAQICNMIGNNGSDQITDKTCAPVTLTMPVNFAFLTPVDPSRVQIRFEWGHDNQTTIYPATFNAGLNRYEVTGTHVYPATLQGNCSYTAEAYIVYDGIACTGTRQRQTFAFWSTDDENSGELHADPVLYRVCQGTPWEVNFQDNSLFNCRIDIEPDRPNQLNRWVQFIYGSNTAGAKIPNVSVTVPAGPVIPGAPAPGVYPLTDAGGNMVPYATPSGFFEGPVIEIPPLALGPNQTSYQLSAPAGGAVGDFVEVTLRNWNICNPYETLGVPTGNAPRITNARVQIVTKPDANIRITKNSSNITEPEVTKFCPGDRIYLRATTTWPTGAAPRHLISIYDGPDETSTRIFYRTTNTRNDISNYLMDNNIQPGFKAVVIESIDRNANGGLSCSDKEIKLIQIVDAPVAEIVTSEGTKNINFCRNDVNDEFYVSFSDNPTYTDQANTVFKWVFKDINKNTETVYGPSVGMPLPTFDNVLYKDPGAYQVIYSTEDLITRCGTTDTAFVNIYSRPIADFEIEDQQVFCARKKIVFKDLSVDFFDLSYLPDDKIISKKWFFDFDNDPATFVEFADGDEISNTYNTPGTYKVRLEVETGFASCSDNVQKDIVIEVLPSPEANFTPPAAACPGSFTFTNNSFNNQPPLVGVVTYFWMIYDEEGEFIEEREGNNATFEYIFTNDLMEDKIYKVRLKAVSENLCEFISEFQDVTVNPAMPARFTSNYDPFDPNCSPKTINFVIDSQTQTLDVQEYVWTINDASGFSETINKAPSETTLDYEFLNSTNSVISYTVSLEVRLNSPFCVNPYQQPLKISPNPVSDFTISKGVENCDEVTLNFNATAKGMTYIWTVNTPALNNPVKNDNFNLIFARPEATEVDLVVEATLEVINSTHCRSTVTTRSFTIPKKTFIPVQLDLLSDDNGCHVFTADFRNSTPSGYPVGTTFDLLVTKGTGTQEIKSITAGSISGNFSYEFESDGVFEVVLRATSPAPDKCEFLTPPLLITVHPEIIAEFKPDFIEGCSPLTVDFEDMSRNLSDIEEIKWTIINKQTGIKIREEVLEPRAKFEEIFTNTSLVIEEYQIIQEAISTEGCIDTYSMDIKVFPEARNEFEVVELPICFPYDVEFRNLSLNDNPPGTTYIWLWGDGTFSESNETEEFITHTYSNTSFTSAIVRNVSLRAITANGCEPEIAPKEIQINHRVQSKIVADKINGCAPLDIVFNNFSKGYDPSESIWYKRRVGEANFEEISSANYTMLHTFNNVSGVDEEYEVIYIAQSAAGCKDTTSVIITVFADLQATFTASPSYQLLPDRTVTITRNDNSIPGSFEYYWDFGDGTTSTEPNPGEHIYPNYGTYDITLTVSGNNCIAKHTETIVIGAITPIVDFEYDPPTGCRPLRVNFTDKSLWTDVSTYHWDFGDGKGTSDAQNPTYTYNEAGIYTVTLTASNETGEVIEERKEFIIEVFDNPRAVFQIRPTLVYLPGKPVYTSNTSINAVSYFWDFGDGYTSTEFEPTHIYTEKGVYDISLTVTNEFGCSNTIILRSAVKVDDGAEIRIPNAFTPSSQGPSGIGGTGGVNDLFMPITEGVTEFNMMIFNRWGELLFESKNINDGWDGYYKGKLCKQDVYVYKIQVKFNDGETATRIGDVTLLR